MTRKHFEAIAKAFRKRYDGAPATAKGQIVMTAEDVADALGDFNPNFDRQRFLTACLGEKS